ncbi:phenylacetic acid degradation protein [Sedimentitalea sp. CY04]|uniref:Phenylacetic acid degradation protein n=1 Tax=Parasedimentitalea denitrificans TaxID=2211118 RepID=A0ABX0WAU1_9RHOB|nr:phenylacetic acid degradation protein [Sedimentitalea sp. CY04]
MDSRIRASFARQNMMHTMGAELTHIGDGEVIITAPILLSSRQQHGVAHAALTFAIGDTAAGYAALTKLPSDQEVMTAEIKINLLSPGQGDYLRATGKVIKPGRRLVVVTAEVHAITDGQEKLIAILQGTMAPVQI